MKKQRNYDKRVKNTRIHLADWLFLKKFSIGAGVSMADALHQLIIGVKPKAEPAKAEPVTEPVTEPIPVSRVKIPVAIRVRLQPAIATNGSKSAIFRIQPKGGRYA